MNILFSDLFWGCLLILFGASIMIRTFFGIDIPILRTLFAILLIYSGIVIITGISRQPAKQQTVRFEEKVIKPETVHNSYTITFGKGIIDLTNIATPQRLQKVKVNVLFGAGIIRIDESIPTVVTVNAAFAGTKLPNENMISFGTYTYRTHPQTNPLLNIEINVVFGSLEIVSV